MIVEEEPSVAVEEAVLPVRVEVVNVLEVVVTTAVEELPEGVLTTPMEELLGDDVLVEVEVVVALAVTGAQPKQPRP